MAKKPKYVMTEEHKEKLRQAYHRRRQHKEIGVILPTQKELRAAAKAKREQITEESVNKLIEETPATEQESRVNNPTVMHFESSPNKRHPLRFREIHEQVNHQKIR